MSTFQGQKNHLEILSGVHGGFKVPKPSSVSGVQKTLKPWLTMVTINYRIYLTIFPTKENKMLFAISYLDGTIFNWVQPRRRTFWKMVTKNKSKKRSRCFTNLTIFAFT